MIRTLSCLTLTVGLLLCTQAGRFTAQEPDAVKKELKKFQGKWQAAAVILNGVPLDDAKVQTTTLTIKGTKYTLKLGDQTSDGTFTIDPETSPKCIDTALTEPDGTTNNFLGVYQWEDGVRKSCFSLPGMQRPDGFRQQQGYVIMEWKKSDAE